MSHSYRTIPDAKFEFGIFSIFGNMTHKLSLSERGEQVSKKNEFFMSRDIPFKPKLTLPLVNFSNFQAEEISLF